MVKLIVANWKMNGNIEKVREDLQAYTNNPITNKSNVLLALPAPYLALANTLQESAQWQLASQDISVFAGTGAYTGEFSADLLKNAGVSYSIIGHSERRMHCGDDSEKLTKKIRNALSSNIVPIFCIGESAQTRQGGMYAGFLTEQLQLLTKLDMPINDMVIAYEPIWAIGTGVVPTEAEIVEAMELVHAFVQKFLPRAKITALYGGSVSGKNAKEILHLSGVDGVLVGGASLLVQDFTTICSAS